MISPETRIKGLPYGEEIMIVDRTVWIQCTSVTDGRTDRRTDRITITKTMQRIASHGKNGHDFAIVLPIDVIFASSVRFLGSADLMVPHSMTFSDPEPQFQGHSIL